MPKIRIYENAKCLVCKVVNRKMVLIGPMCFCTACANLEFGVSILHHEIPSTNVRYKKWIKFYKEAK